nr:response regulator [uncultured Clostridium sp.]
MKNVLVAEDCKIIRKGISAMIERCQVPVEQILECKNGLEALEIIGNMPVDVLITDIRMPEMDGITLVKELQKNQYIPRIVAVSGYDDFSCAVDLLRCGAREYLLKPVKREELNSIMVKLEEEIQQEQAEKRAKKALCYSQLRRILLSENVTREEMEEAGRLNWFSEEEFSVVCGGKTLTDLKNTQIYSFPDLEGCHVVLMSAEDARDLALSRGDGCSFGISDSYHGLWNLRKAYEQAKQRRIHTFCLQKEGGQTGCSCLLPPNELECFVQRIGTQKNNKNEAYLLEITDRVKRGDMEGVQFQELICQIISRVKEFYGRILAVEEIAPDRLCHMLEFDNIDDYCTEIRRIFSCINQRALIENDDYKNRIKLEQALAYINENYPRNINMAMVSNHVSMNYTVFSIAFKEYTGDNFVSYLRKIRVNEAKRLLSDTDYKIGEIGQMTGYEDPKHFMKIFKWAAGVTPSEFRKNLRVRDGKTENITPKTKIVTF